MSDTYFDPEDYEGLETRKRAIPVPQIKKWEAAERRLAELEAREAARERAAALQQAGIPEQFGALFREDAPLDTIKAALSGMGIQTPQTQATNASLAGHQAAQDLHAGASSAEPSSVGNEIAAMKQAARGRRNATNAESERQKLLNLMQQSGTEVKPGDWQLPKQMVQ